MINASEFNQRNLGWSNQNTGNSLLCRQSVKTNAELPNNVVKFNNFKRIDVKKKNVEPPNHQNTRIPQFFKTISNLFLKNEIHCQN
jgi:hypothetical protein